MSLDNVEDAFVLTPIQSGMLYASLATPDQDTYVTYVTLGLSGSVDTEKLKRAWHSAYHMHQALRAEFHWDGLEEPLQVIAKEVKLPWVTLDWTGMSADQVDTSMYQLVAKERLRKIDISTAPLSRITLVKVAERRWRILWSVHHLLADGVSTPNILSDVLECYQSDRYCDQTDHSIYQYSQYVHWLAAQDQQAANTYWRTYLNSASATPTKLRARSAFNQGEEASTIIPLVKFGLSLSQTRNLTEFCQSHRITLSTFLHAAWALLLQRYSHSNSLLFASTVSGRHSDIEGMEKSVGLYLNAQPRLIDIERSLSLVDWMQAIQADIHSSAKYDYSQLGVIQKYISAEDTDKAFESIITIAGHSSELDIGSGSNDIQFSDIDYQITQSHYPLAFIAAPGNVLDMELVYDSHRYFESDVQGMAQYLEGLINVMVANASVTPDELNNLVGHDSICKGRIDPVTGAGHDSIHQWIESVADENPDSPCVLFESETVTYAELDARANQIARLILQSVKSDKSVPIGLMLPRSIDQIAALLGILKSGYAYVPIDPSYPQTTIQSLLEAATLTHIVTDQSVSSKLENSPVNHLYIKDTLSLSRDRVENVEINSENLAYVMFTSGSTGVPKGVKITHDNLMYSTATRVEYYQSPIKNFLLLSSIAFDSSVAGIYWSLCSGGKLVIPRPEQEKDIEAIAKTIESESVSHTLCLPSYYQLLLNYTNARQLASLNVVIVAGESCPRELVDLHKTSQVNAKLYNEYGPTEACVWSSVYQFSDTSEDDIPIGKPVGTTWLEVVDPLGRVCPVGVEGEIVIGGPGVSPGYFNNDTQTAAQFVANPVADTSCAVIYRTGDIGYRDQRGNLVHAGRVDRQLKIRGYRIEPGDIETVLNDHPAITRSAVVSIDQARLSTHENINQHHTTRASLVAYYVNQTEQTADADSTDSRIVTSLDEQALRQYCDQRLPAHMCPARFVALNRFPTLPNGKLAYRDLPVPTKPVRRTSSSNDRNNSEVTVLLIELLKNLLGVEEIQADDNFFEIGGDSITAIQFISQARSAGLSIGIEDFTHSKSIADIAALSETATGKLPCNDRSAEKTSGNFSASGLTDSELDDFLDAL